MWEHVPFRQWSWNEWKNSPAKHFFEFLVMLFGLTNPPPRCVSGPYQWHAVWFPQLFCLCLSMSTAELPHLSPNSPLLMWALVGHLRQTKLLWTLSSCFLLYQCWFSPISADNSLWRWMPLIMGLCSVGSRRWPEESAPPLCFLLPYVHYCWAKLWCGKTMRCWQLKWCWKSASRCRKGKSNHSSYWLTTKNLTDIQLVKGLNSWEARWALFLKPIQPHHRLPSWLLKA